MVIPVMEVAGIFFVKNQLVEQVVLDVKTMSNYTEKCKGILENP